jgi:uncharacterized integral membrane protein
MNIHMNELHSSCEMVSMTHSSCCYYYLVFIMFLLCVVFIMFLLLNVHHVVLPFVVGTTRTYALFYNLEFHWR